MLKDTILIEDIVDEGELSYLPQDPQKLPHYFLV